MTMDIRKYRKLPVEIEAVQHDGTDESLYAIKEWLDEAFAAEFGTGNGWGILINSREGIARAEPGYWVVKGVEGEAYCIAPEIFAKTYEEVADGDYEYALNEVGK